MPLFHDDYNEWKGDIYTTPDSGCQPPDGGLILKNISHQNYNFARDMRTIGLWIEYSKVEATGSSKEKKFYILDKANFSFECIEQWKEGDLNPSAPATPVGDPKADFINNLKKFAIFRYIFGIRARYTSKPNFFPANCEFSKLVINQSYLFTKYSNVPAHEPTGGLHAARIYPLLQTDFEPNTGFNAATFPNYKINSIRFDYRFHINLDTFIDTPSPSPTASSPAAAPSNNYAGVFRDLESFSKFGAATGGASKAIFEASEKPLLLEITAKGYQNSSHSNQNTKFWDNVHWWGQRWKSSKSLFGTVTKTIQHISAPGGFFAAHFHWRWGKAARDEAPGAPQYIGSTSNEYLLIDPALSPQNFSFAITKYDAAKDPNTGGVTLQSLSNKDDFFATFNPGASAATPKGTGTPTDISGGENIVLWISIEVLRSEGATKQFSGTQLIQGIFFAHNSEPGFFSKAGTTSAQYFPTNEKTIRASKLWERY